MIKKYLNEQEQQDLLDYLTVSKRKYSMHMMLLMFSGLRTHELWSLCIKHIDFKQNTITLWSAAKGSNGRVVGLPTWFVSRARGKVVSYREKVKMLKAEGVKNPNPELEDLPLEEHPLVFAFGYDSQGGGRVSFQAVLRREWQHIKKAVFQNKLDLGLHCLRHTFAVKLYQHSFDPLLVQNLMGHKSYSSTEKYLKYADETKQLEVSRRLYEERVLKCQ